MSRRRPGSKHFQRLDKHKWAKARRLCLERDRHRCTECGGAGSLECHHVKRLEDGGDPYALDNLATLCRPCHIQLHRPVPPPDVQEWRDFMAKTFPLQHDSG